VYNNKKNIIKWKNCEKHKNEGGAGQNDLTL